MSESDDTLAELIKALGGQDSDQAKAFAAAVERTKQRKTLEPDEVEVRAWLATTNCKWPIALNHFSNRLNAERFVEDVYAAGAVRVVAANIAYHDAAEHGGPYTDTLHVVLPDTAQERIAVIELCNAHCMADSSSGAKFVDEGQSRLVLWWD